MAANPAPIPIATYQGNARENACAVSANATSRAHPAATKTPMSHPPPIAAGKSKAQRERPDNAVQMPPPTSAGNTHAAM